MRFFAARVERATPPDRDRAVDGLRALAVLGVVLGHWLVTALVSDSGGLHGASPLQHLPYLTPVSWVFQTLAVFFFVGGRVGSLSWEAARAKGVPYRRWLGARLARLFRPVAALLVVWAVAAVVALCCGAEAGTLHVLLKLVVSPLWFLLVFAGLTAATPFAARLHPLWPLAVVLHIDLLRFGLGTLSGATGGGAGPGWADGLGRVNVLAGWLVPYCLGARWARGELDGRRAGLVLLLGGAGASALLIALGGYPASMVGVPGGAVSNLDPPTLAAVAFGLAQCGGALLLVGPLRRRLRRPLAWAAVALLNLSTMTVFLWHQTAMMTVTVSALRLGGPLPGLHTVPDGPGWVLARLLWLPVFAFALLLCWAAFRTYEQGRRGPNRGAASVRTAQVTLTTRVVRRGRPTTGPERGGHG
ncbi:acyltransferase [Streptomyces sp. NPDC049954]|uniref:acyltransferase family protein n=1 Tax=Streptomyces sp. NPDC049954 TaxID=3155779 RepID=UPI00343AD361